VSEAPVEEARASLEEGDLERARAAYRRALELHPDDVESLVDLGYLCFAGGDAGEAAGYFQRAIQRDPSNQEALRGLVDAFRRQGSSADALEAAANALMARPDDVLVALDAAELALELGRLQTAEAAFRRVRALDDDPEHDVYTLHALIEVETRREDWRKALDLAVEATRVDRLGRTTDVLAFIVAQVFGSERPAPERDVVERALAVSRAEHRRRHLEVLP
jgi:tetratricopeptide (TPR) repeat protein